MHQGRRPLVVPALHRLVVELLNAVFNALLALTHGVRCIQSAFTYVRGAAEKAHLFKNDHFLGVRLMRRNRRSQAGAATADHDDVGLIRHFTRGMLFHVFSERVDVAACFLQAFFHALL